MPASRPPEERLPALVRAEAQRILAESEVEADPARVAVGWERRFVIEGARAAEMVRLYEELGFEAVADPLRLGAAHTAPPAAPPVPAAAGTHAAPGDQCADCRLLMALDFRMLYTRRLDPHVARIVQSLELTRHPEGGWYREIHRSTQQVRPADGRAERPALTVIHFLVTDGAPSAWHRLVSDEAWHWVGGAPLELWTWDEGTGEVRCDPIGPLSTGAAPVRVVRGGCWQAARTQGAFSLVSCSVGPGFEFADFALLRDDPVRREALRAAHPEAASFL